VKWAKIEEIKFICRTAHDSQPTEHREKIFFIVQFQLDN